MRTITLFALAAIAPAFSQAFKAEPVPNPSGKGSLQQNWSTTPDGNLVLSWIEPTKGDSFSLRYAVRRGTAWSEARTVAANRHFFRHPAEAPEVIALSDKSWLAHWIEMPSEENEAEYLYVSASHDGVTWTKPAMAHKDRSPVEHGLASMIATSPTEASLLWLEMPKGEEGPAYLKRTVVNAEGAVLKEERLDSDVCSCCPTAVAKTAKGLLIAYRDHTPEDIRDISVLRFENGAWSKPLNVYADKWEINACPTNAAAVGAKGDRAAVAWFTGAQDKPRTEIAFSTDGGTTFGKPTVLSTGHSYGYVSMALDDDGSAVVSWLEQGDGKTLVRARQVSASGAPGPVVKIAEGGRKDLGYPRIVHAGKETWIAWGADTVQTARLKK
jgi:hypothetical protein